MKNIIRKILKEEFHSDSEWDSDWDWMGDGVDFTTTVNYLLDGTPYIVEQSEILPNWVKVFRDLGEDICYEVVSLNIAPYMGINDVSKFINDMFKFINDIKRRGTSTNLTYMIDFIETLENKIKTLMTEQTEDEMWGWYIEEQYRFFDVYICHYNEYDEDTDEDECVEGFSSFLKIPTYVVEDIWGLDVDDMGGPGDEGLGVIEWGLNNGKFDEDYEYVEYVREISKREFCMAVGHGKHYDICGENNEIGKGIWVEE